ncbi:IS200/IS605 family transposase, partial [Thiolapillus sp.]|uniref:IS200/IS605 family transposase n=2 Tax=Thiolapillus sp. TaxID=2017437 RepID=UPI003AF5A52A
MVSIPPQLSVSKLVQKLKGKTSYKLQREYRSLQKAYWGQRMWARGYFACSTGVTTHPYQHRAVPKRPFEWRPADCIPDLPWSAGNWRCGNR